MAGISYPKEFVKPDGRKLISGGPRDLQRRQENQHTPDIDIISLKTEFNNLKEELRKTRLQKMPDGFFSPEQVDEEIRNAVEQAVKETMESLKNTDSQVEINEFKKEIERLKQNLDMKEELITALKYRAPVNDTTVEEPDRPKMEQQFIDPLDKDAGKGLKSHIDIVDVSTTDTSDMSKKVDKLKGLLGKLPNKN